MGKTQKTGTDGPREPKGGREKGAPARRRLKPHRAVANNARRTKRRTVLATRAISRRVAKANAEMKRLAVSDDLRMEIAAKFSHRPTNKLVRSIHRYVRASRLAAAQRPLPPTPEVPNASA